MSVSMQSRAALPVSLPVENATVPYWHALDGQPHSIAKHRTTRELPKTSVSAPIQYVIIGSGISGASIAYHLLERAPQSSVMMLEARAACSGATGRNGGHTKPSAYRDFMADVQAHGLKEAIAVAKLKRSNMLATREIIKRHNIKCDLTDCDTIDVVFDDAAWKSAKKTTSWMNENISGGDEVERYTIVETPEAQKISLCPDAKGALVYNAGSLTAYGLTVGMLEYALTKGLNLQTETPVVSLHRNESDNLWMVKTNRGDIMATNVILATNGYTAHLIPQLQGKVVPLRGQITAQRPGKNLVSPLPTTYSFVHDLGYEYMIPRPAGSKWADDIVIGGGWPVLPNGGAEEFGVTDDSMCETRVGQWLRDCTAKYFKENWGQDHEDGRVRKEWTGIMGATADGHPYVGAIPGMSGVWTSVGFNGHGMVLCLKCAEGLVDIVLSNEGKGSGTSSGMPKPSEKVAQWFPKSFLLNEERLNAEFNGRRDIKPLSSDQVDALLAQEARGQVNGSVNGWH